MFRMKKGSGALATTAAMTGRLNAPCEEGGWASSSGKKWLSCILEGRSDAKKASSWQDIAEMHARMACFWQDRCLMYVLSREKR